MASTWERISHGSSICNSGWDSISRTISSKSFVRCWRTSFLWVTPDDWLSLCERCRSCGKAWPLLGNASSLFNPTTIHPDAGFANAIHALQGRKATAIDLFQRLERQVGTIDNRQRSNEKAGEQVSSFQFSVFSFKGLGFRVWGSGRHQMGMDAALRGGNGEQCDF